MEGAKNQPPMKQRILLLVTVADWGGVQSFLVHFAADLMKEGHEVLLAAGGDGELWDRAKALGIPTHRLRHVVRDIEPWNDVKGILEIRALIKSWKPDAIDINSSKMGILGSIANTLVSPRPRCVYRIGGWVFLEPMSATRKWIYKTAERMTAPLKDIIITVHPNDEKLARALQFKPRETITTVPNGIDVANFVSQLKTKQDARQALGLPERAFVYGTVANAYPPKDLSNYFRRVVTILDEDRSAHVVVIGGGPQFKELQATRDSLAHSDRIHLTGQIADAPTLYSAFDAFVLPSIKEGMPWSVLEAMAANIPVIVTDVGACKWMVTSEKHGNAGIVIPVNDTLALQDAMRSLRNSQELREALARGGRYMSLNRFSWDVTYRGNRDALFQR